MERVEISKLYENSKNYSETEINVSGWVRTSRESKTIGFVEINDGSCLANLQAIVLPEKVDNFKELANASVGSSVEFSGILVLTPESKQPFELQITKGVISGGVTEDYPLQKKRHTLEFLRTIPHLRTRTNTFNAVFRVRSEAAFALHQFFHENGFCYIHTPIITGSDCEGAGEMFRVTTLDMNSIPLLEDKQVDYSKDFFGRESHLTVSGQLDAEGLALALGKVYTFGPTFRSENSYTPRHAAEFWMLEPEMAFCDLRGDMLVAEAMIKYVVSYLLDRCSKELEFFNNFYDKELIERLSLLSKSDFERVEYTEAIKILEKNNGEFDYKAEWGCDLQTEHERFLTEKIFHKPIFVINYPKDIKAFYMRMNDDNKTVAATDMLVPGVGELIGGSQREERYDMLMKRIKELGLKEEEYETYLDLRRYGSVVHSGFGLGFERLLMYVTGISNIRDVIPYPRTAGGF